VPAIFVVVAAIVVPISEALEKRWESRADAVPAFDSGVVDVGAADTKLLWLAGDSGVIQLTSEAAAGSNDNVVWVLIDSPEWLRMDSDGLLHFSAPMEASSGKLMVTAFSGGGAAMGEYAVEYVVREGRVVAASTVGAGGGEILHPDRFFGVRIPGSALRTETEFKFIEFGTGRERVAMRLHVPPGAGAGRKSLRLVFPASEEGSVRGGKGTASGCENMLPSVFIESLDEKGWHIELCRSATFMRAFFSLAPGIDIATALNRVPNDREEFSLEDFPADRFEIVRQPAAVLASLCGPGPGNTNCDNRAPVLLIHGLSVGGGFGGGKSVWNDLASLLQGYDGGSSRFAVYEFYYRTNARFVDIARDLDIAIRKIHSETGGRKVRLIAHSFGGLVARTWLQGLADPVRSITPPGSGASMRDTFVESLLTIGTPHSGVSGSSVRRHQVRLPKGRDGLAGSTISICRQISCWEAGADEASGLAGELFAEAWSMLYGVSETPGEVIARLADFENAALDIPVRSLLSLVSSNRTAQGLFTTVPSSRFYLDGDGLISYQGQRFSPELSCNDDFCEDRVVTPIVNQPTNPWVEEKVLGAGGFPFPFPGAPVSSVGSLVRDYKHSRFIPQSAGAIQPSINADFDLPALGWNEAGIWASTHDALNQILDWLAPGEVESVLELIVRGRGSVRIESQPHPVTCSSYCLVPVSRSSVTLLTIPASAPGRISVSGNCKMLDSRRCRVTFSGWGATQVTFDDPAHYGTAIEP